ncbi:SIMPL domain-containing protein [Massilia violaceinigra]|uniref:SIMPL domain-containing protein n=1 Tax=Massilia violaceinigra TaxID=2045208 RepID=A0A2D2DNV2_9BURK|nr:SIMPL domain-containing protein [Massilia violaceinigra]ATQ76665.1 SIMPL domain-containing protein [Massilia violaceinigra]
MLKTIAAVGALTLLPVAAQAAGLPDYPFIHVSGMGTTTAMPDLGQIDFEISAFDADPAVAVGVVQTRATEIRAAMEQAGVPLEDVEVRDVRKDFRKPDPNAAPGPVQYDIRAGVRINVRDLTKWRGAAAPLLNMPNLDGFMTVFDTTQREKIEMELATDAIKIARRKAEGIAVGLGRKLGPASAVSTGDLKNLTRAMGLAPNETNYRSSPQTGMDKADVLTVMALKFAQPVDVIYRFK